MTRYTFATWLAAGLAVAVAAVPVAAAPFDKSGITDWTKPPAPGPEPTFRPPTATRSRLPNGIALLVIENHTLPIVAIDLLVPGAGTAADPKHKAGLASFTADLLDEGAGGLSVLEIAEEAGRLGAQIATYAEPDAARVSASALGKTLEPTLDLIVKIVAQPAFAASELTRVKSDLLTALEQRRDRPPEISSIVLSEALFGPASAYGHPRTGVRADVQGFTVADVQAFYRAHWNPAAMTLVVVGDVDTHALEAKLAAGLGAWRPTGASPVAPPGAAPAKLAHRLLLVDRPGAAQSDVRIGTVGPDRHDPRYFAFEVLRTTFGGGFTGRITQRLREQLGIIYHAYANMLWRVAPGPFVVDAAIVTPETATGVSEVLKILDDLATNELSVAELDKSKQNLVRALPAMFDTNAETADAFVELALHKLPDDWYARFADGVRKVTARDVKAAAQAMLPSGRMAISIVGDLSKIRPALDKLGLGEPAMYDLDGAAVPAR
jgi:zinc protease